MKHVLGVFAIIAAALGLSYCLSGDGIAPTTARRTSVYPIEPLILHRSSPRAFSNEPVSPEDLMTLFEAARWAPSSYNNQPWRFIYVYRDSPEWDMFLSFMVDFNRQWAQHAGALVVIVAKKIFEHNGKPSGTHSFDTGAAWENLALQASSMGLVAHGMSGFDAERARTQLGIPDDYDVQIMCAIGWPGVPHQLPKEMQAGEQPSGRKPLEDLIFEGTMATDTKAK